jgi:hypothetical protein
MKLTIALDVDNGRAHPGWLAALAVQSGWRLPALVVVVAACCDNLGCQEANKISDNPRGIKEAKVN